MGSPRIQNTPIITLPLLDIYGLSVNYVSSTTITIDAGQCRDSNDVMDIVLGSAPLNGLPTAAPLVVDITKVGPGGRDQGSSIAINEPWLIYMIADSRYHNPVSAVLSAQQNALKMPFGYDSFRLIGWVFTDALGAIKPFDIAGVGNLRSFQYMAPQNVLSSGTATVLTDLALAPAVPYTTYTKVLLQVRTNSATAPTDSAQFRPKNSPVIYYPYTLMATGNNQMFQIIPFNENTVPTLQYQLSQAGDSIDLYVQGFDFSI